MAKLDGYDAADLLRESMQDPQWGWSQPMALDLLNQSHAVLMEQGGVNNPAELCIFIFRHDINRYLCQHDLLFKAQILHTEVGSCRN